MLPATNLCDEVVISGLSGRFPESENVDEFSDNLIRGVDMVTEDGRRWEASKIEKFKS